MPKSNSLKIGFILGTRPEIIKLYSVMKASLKHKQITPVFIHTGQHYDYEMSQVFLEELKLPSLHHFLNVRSGSHGEQTAALLIAIENALKMENPDIVIVVGDTNTTLAGALTASKLQIPVAHVEAGCRSFDFSMPEEANRLIVDSISSILFAPSEVAAMNLLFEGKPDSRVFLAGNTAVDIVEMTTELRRTKQLDKELNSGSSVVVTLHRQENVDDKTRLTQLLKAIGKIKAQVVFPIHPRTRKRIEEFKLSELVKNMPNLHLVKPLNYISFMKLLEEAKIVITDSGGVQEEAIMVGTPCITARDTTEWPETVWAGGNYLAGTNAKNVTKLSNELLARPPQTPITIKNPFKGNAGPNIIKILVNLWRKEKLNFPKPEMSQGNYPLPWLVKDLSRQEEFYTTLKFNANGQTLVDEKSSFDQRIVRRYKK
jgi:UDP-N-acetylglucosamine 2-epimerase (non-hydrolysing)